MKKVILFLFLFSKAIPSFTQIQLSQQVIGSAGGFGSTGSVTISSTTGETSVTTLSNSSVHLTQGFQQPLIGGTAALMVTLSSKGTSCNIARDGFAVASVTGGVAPFSYQWFPLPVSNTDDTLKNVGAGKYWVTVTAFNGFTRTDTIIVETNGKDCEPKLYSISPNGDNHNERLEIDNIQYFPENELLIFNRWGDKVWGNKNYNNIDVVWDGKNQSGVELPDGTYFYILTTSVKKYQGWVEITR